jgi:hypothetical protein
MSMYADEKPANVSEYVKLLRTRLPARISGVQFGFGHTCGAENGLTDRDGTLNCPFFVEATVAVLSVAKFAVCDSTGLFLLVPELLQSMIAE